MIGPLVPVLAQASAYRYAYKAIISHIASNKSLTKLILWKNFKLT